MIAVAVVLIVSSGLLAAAGAAFVAWRGRGVLASRVHQAVIVTLKSGDAYRGVLFEEDRHALVLRNAEALNADGTRVMVDGELLVLRPDVAYIQRP